MDMQIVVVYDIFVEVFVQEWCEQFVFEDLYVLLCCEFKVGGVIVDIGCGVGCEVVWFNVNGYLVVGYDVLVGLLEVVWEQYLGLFFWQVLLFELVGIVEGVFDNVFCEIVIMYLLFEQIGVVVECLVLLLCQEGMLYLSWWVMFEVDQCDGCGWLFMLFDVVFVCQVLVGIEFVFDEVVVSQLLGWMIYCIVVCKV